MRIARLIVVFCLTFVLAVFPWGSLAQPPASPSGCPTVMSSYCQTYNNMANSLTQLSNIEWGNNLAVMGMGLMNYPLEVNQILGFFQTTQANPQISSVLGAAYCLTTNACSPMLQNQLQNILNSSSLADSVSQVVGLINQLDLGGIQNFQNYISQLGLTEISSIGSALMSSLMSHLGLGGLGLNLPTMISVDQIQNFLNGLQGIFSFAPTNFSLQDLISGVFNLTSLAPLPLDPGQLVPGLPSLDSLSPNLTSLNFPFNQFPALMNQASVLTPALVDIPFASEQQLVGFTVVSGGTPDDQFTPEACYGKRCRQVELLPIGGAMAGEKFLAWIHGSDQRVLGGKPATSDEPTGQKPYPPEIPFKLVIKDIREKQGEIEFALYYQLRFRLPGGIVIATPHFFGPLPVIPPFTLFVPPVAREGKDQILIQRNFASAPLSF